MNRKSSDRARTGHLSCLAFALCGLAVSCAGPERTPRQPIKGIDTERHDVQNPHDEKGEGRGEGLGQATTGFLDEFVGEVAKAHEGTPGIIAVFPALTTGDAGVAYVTRLGEHLMQETTNGLEARGVTAVISGAGLQNDLIAVNRGLDALRNADDVFWLADRLGADYVVHGSTQKKTFDAAAGDVTLQIDWECKRMSDRSTVAAWRPRLTSGALGRDLARFYRTESTWKIGDAAPKFTPDIALERKILTQSIARRIATTHGDTLRGKSVSVDARSENDATDAARDVADHLRQAVGMRVTTGAADYQVRGEMVKDAGTASLRITLVDASGSEITESAPFDPQFGGAAE